MLDIHNRDIAAITPLSNGELYCSPWGLLPFQADGVAECYVRTDTEDGVCVVYDTGIGKTHVAMALTAYLFLDDQIDLAIVIAEKNKVTDWRNDFHAFTALTAHRYHGQGRQRRLAKAGIPHVLTTTYATGRSELVRGSGRSKKARSDGPLVDTLDLRNKRVLWILDEPAALRNRGSETYRAYEHLLTSLRAGPYHQRLVALTATPLERDYEDSFNLGRIIAPGLMPTVGKFNELFVRSRDMYRRPVFRPGRAPVFAAMFQQMVIRKRKTDPDVIDQFPKAVEESIGVPLEGDHARLYETIEGLFDDPDGEGTATAQDDRRLFTALRLTAGHPAAHLHAQNEISQTVVEMLGAEYLRSIRPAKVDALLAKLEVLVRGQGAQVVIFTFFGNTVLRELERELLTAGYILAVYKGAHSRAVNDQAKETFLSGHAEILLASDAAARGIDLPNAQYVIEYESATTYSKRSQRINRISRLSSQHPSVTCYTMVVEETVEEGLLGLMMKRNRDQDILLGDEADDTAFISAQERRKILHEYRRRRNSAR